MDSLLYNHIDHYEIMIILIHAGADVNRIDQHGDTALLWASIKGHTEVVDLLRNAGA